MDGGVAVERQMCSFWRVGSTCRGSDVAKFRRRFVYDLCMVCVSTQGRTTATLHREDMSAHRETIKSM